MISSARQIARQRWLLVAVAAFVHLIGWLQAVGGATLVDNPFVNSYSGWTDAFPSRGGSWRLSLHHPTLMDTNNANPPTTGGGTNTGLYEPDVLVQNNFLAPDNYELAARMRTNDDDLLGLVWNYQDPDNYFRVGLRQQPSGGNFGGTDGLSVQKIAGGVVTQLVGPGVASPITQAMIDNRTPFDVKVAVNGANYEIFFNGASVASGSDAALAADRRVGIQSWAQQSDLAPVTPSWGTEIETFKVTQGAATLFNESFDRRPVQWRQVVMRNASGTSGQDVTKEMLGNFGMGIGNPWIHQDSNGNLTATTNNIDFIGPAVAVNEPGSANFSNYQMQVRMGAADNDGMGALVRVQDDNNFYRITFTNDATGPGPTRALRGMSLHKVRNGTWTELYRDDSSPLFVPDVAAPGTTPASPGFPMFDLTVGALGNALQIQVRNQAGDVINYPIITDNSDPILTGAVGFHTWDNEDVYYMSKDGLDRPLLTSMSAFTDFDVVVNRATGNIELTNNSAAPADIRGVSILSSSGALIPANWLNIANKYDEPSPPTPGNGSIDPDDAWTITSSTAFSLSEREQTGNGGTLGVGQIVNFGNAWNRHFEDVVLQIELISGAVVDASLGYTGGDVWDNSSGSGLWSDAVNWADNTEPTAASTVIFPVGFPNGDSVITLSAAETAAALILSDNYTLSGGSLTLPAGASISVAAGTTATITSALNVGTWTKSGDGTLAVPNVRADVLTVGAGEVAILPNGGNSGTSAVGNLSLNGTSRFDLNNNDLVVRATALSKDAEHANIEARIVSAQNGLDPVLITKWDGPGITSSTARTFNVAQGFDLTGIGVIRNSDLDVTTGIPNSSYTSFSGQAVTPDDVLVKYTYIGDANLSGAVSFDDYVGMDNAFFGLIPNLGWATGDINFDNVINFDDYSKVDQAFFFQGAPLTNTDVAAAVPEPGTCLILAIGVFVSGVVSRRRIACLNRG